MASGAAELTKSWIKRAREVTRIGTLRVRYACLTYNTLHSASGSPNNKSLMIPH